MHLFRIITFLRKDTKDKQPVLYTEADLKAAGAAAQREYADLLNIRDNYPKYLLRTDAFAEGNYEGVKTMHIADFLLMESFE